jgi:hypothetical protein
MDVVPNFRISVKLSVASAQSLSLRLCMCLQRLNSVSPPTCLFVVPYLCLGACLSVLKQVYLLARC